MDKTEKNIKMKIKSRVSEFPVQSPEKQYGSLKTQTASEKESAEKESDNTCELLTDGTLVRDGSKISIKYCERADMGFETDTVTILDIDTENPNVVTMVRTGDGATACRFDSEKSRQICVYEVAGIPLELAIKTNSVAHSITENGGRINLDYTIELRGMSTQRNQMEIEVYGV